MATGRNLISPPVSGTLRAARVTERRGPPARARSRRLLFAANAAGLSGLRVVDDHVPAVGLADDLVQTVEQFREEFLLGLDDLDRASGLPPRHRKRAPGSS